MAPPHTPPSSARPPRLLPRLLCLLALLGLSRGAPASTFPIPKEYQLKAGFLYNFSKFVQWPEDRFDDEGSAIVIAVLGTDRFGGELDRVVKDRLVEGRAIVVRHIKTAAEIPSAHIVFVSRDAEPLVVDSLHTLPGVLTVGETTAFTARGGIVAFYVMNDKVRFEINSDAAEKAGLKLSGQLLKLADIRRAP
jgi:hypothetical protein